MKIDLLDPTNYSYTQPYDQFRWLRENDPVHWHDEPNGKGFWALTRHAHVKEMETKSDVFANEPTIVINDDMVFGDENHKHLLFEDPPGHTQHRRFFTVELQPIPVRSQREHLDELVTGVIDGVIERGECDLVEDLSGPLASFVIADVMGITRDEAQRLFPAAEILVRGISITDGPGAEAAAIVFEAAHRAFVDRKGNPTDDWMGRMANGGWDGHEDVDELQFTLDFLLMVNGGSDTTRNLVATGMWELIKAPSVYAELVADPSLIPQAVEEMLRFNPPIVYQRRTATSDYELGGKTIRKGDKVVGFYGAANRDPEVFADPDVFDIRRSPNPHLAFGSGRHLCAGVHLARLELAIMFRELIRRIPDMELAGPVGWYDYPDVPAGTGPTSMPIRFTPGVREGSQAASVPA
ncbi:cytochrome P450 [Aeromicrobium fastidiosum]|uniref:Cytochrome P450 n=1 Tax=Aeromicrobium fastidiosum TaxID=52699 RepID=A0A641APQ7_9ACTN|nr:cytochrome P450 [Aeromicrobium fastidiosum]KAA1379919.1 cytochrome P450 [Aeromicrobium fastidiosum]MBP2389425.1 cytochrome P450 [Aeromicrobium fastidiosum]